MAAFKGELAKLRERVDNLRKLAIADEAIIAGLRKDLEGMTRERDALLRDETAIHEAARAYLSSLGIGPNTSPADPDLNALADVVFS